ncbi:MAG: choice-of-anchor B family protein [Phycisphaerae bacterium]|jgi:choice-of-anchor B domain-containing protein|nr:choice-of-anchor B family protein [Phycisphaerae bacterium]
MPTHFARSASPRGSSLCQPLIGGAAKAVFLSALAGMVALASAHEGDPKATEKHIPYIGPAWRQADGGVAGETFVSSGVSLKAWFPANTFNQRGVTNTSGNDCWGYVTPLGKEIAIVGLSGGTGFVDVTNPAASQIVAFVAGPNSLWRNVKTYQHYCYAVSEGGGGIQVFDLAGIDNGVVTQLPSVTTGGSAATHTMIINEQTGYLYRMGGGSNGIRIYSLANPASPTFVGQWQDKYTHDGFVLSYDSGPYAGKEIFFACGGLNNGFAATGLDIIDVTNKASPVTLGSLQYPQAAYCHQAWITQDRKHIYINDEIDEANFGLLNVGRIVNVENLAAPTLVGTYTTGLTSVDHNLYVKGNTLFCSNYKTGLQIFDVSNQLSPQKIAYFDTYPDTDATGYAGLWSNYPFFPSGTVIGSDIERGLFVWRIEPPVASFGYPNGTPTFVNPVGGETLVVNVTPINGATIAAGSEKLVVKVGASTTEYPLTSLGSGSYLATFPAFACGEAFEYWVSVTGENGIVTTDPPGGVAAIAALSEPLLVNDTMEVPSGWIVGAPSDTATSGIWVNVDPNGTSAQPEDDHTTSGTKAWVTGQGDPGAAAGQADIDGGVTTLTSPRLFLAGVDDPVVSYWRWYSNNQGGNPNTDSWPIEISNDGGAHWAQLELVTENAGAWVKRTFHVADFVQPTDNVYVRFVARDIGTAALVEAGIDDFTVSYFECPEAVVGDLDGDGHVAAADLAILLGQWGGPGTADLDGNGIVQAPDLAILLGNWG